MPRLAFVNKLDREGADPDGVVAQLRGKLRLNAAAIQLPIGLSADHTGVVDLVENVAITFDGDSGEKMSKGAIPPELAEAAAAKRQALLEALADVDDEIADLFLADEQPSAVASRSGGDSYAAGQKARNGDQRGGAATRRPSMAVAGASVAETGL